MRNVAKSQTETCVASRQPRRWDGETLADVVAEEVHGFIARANAGRVERGLPRAKRSAIKDRLAEELGVCRKQVERYMTGENDMTLRQALRLCDVTASTGLVEYMAYRVGLVAVEVPSPDDVAADDVALALARAVKEVGEAVAAAADAIDAKPSVDGALAMAREMREAHEALRRVAAMISNEIESALRARDRTIVVSGVGRTRGV